MLYSHFSIKGPTPSESSLRTIVPVIDPYQQQNDVLSNHQKFRIDGFTEFIISELQPKTTVVYQFYPEEEVVKK